MVEVFKTNVQLAEEANLLLFQIHRVLKDYKANFDLEDEDSILRVKCLSGVVDQQSIISLVKDYGYEAEVLTDELALG